MNRLLHSSYALYLLASYALLENFFELSLILNQNDEFRDYTSFIVLIAPKLIRMETE